VINRQERTLLKYSLLLAISISNLFSSDACSSLSRSTRSTSAFVYCDWEGGSENVTVPETEIWAVISEHAICGEDKVGQRMYRCGSAKLTISSTTFLTSSSLSIPTAFPISDNPSVKYVAVSFLIDHLGARSMACWTRPVFRSYEERGLA